MLFDKSEKKSLVFGDFYLSIGDINLYAGIMRQFRKVWKRSG